MFSTGVLHMEGFRERFLMLKMNKNVSLDEIAESIGSYKATLSRVVNGKSRLTDDLLTSLANYFNVSKSYLLGETNIKQQQAEPPREIIDLVQKAVDNGLSLTDLNDAIEYLKHIKQKYEK